MCSIITKYCPSRDIAYWEETTFCIRAADSNTAAVKGKNLKTFKVETRSGSCKDREKIKSRMTTPSTLLELSSPDTLDFSLVCPYLLSIS
jgi:hypothetical protein